MAFSGNFMCTSFKQELLEAEHDFNNGAHTFRMALYTDSASFNAATTAYTTGNEISGTGYTAKGVALANVNPTTSGTTAIADFSPDASWSTATFSAMGAMIFNDSHASDASVLILDFGALKTATAGTFTVAFPVADASNAIIRIA
jgi:hypothetical protein|tara:strand:+ start:36 stop:470 length:435 start_codon:yes stop_codon:yes gene_type:complete